MMKEQAQRIARVIVNSILDKGISKSTWREQHQAAFVDLLTYREDMISEAANILKRLEVVK